jgi:hypothetical protein
MIIVFLSVFIRTVDIQMLLTQEVVESFVVITNLLEPQLDGEASLEVLVLFVLHTYT